MYSVKKILLVVMLSVVHCSLSHADEVRYLTTDEFKQLFFDFTKTNQWQYKGEKPCVIDFYTTWCGPCKRLAPIMAELAEDYCDQVVFYKVDTERERSMAYFFGISSIPQILFVPVDGQPQLARGLLPKEILQHAIGEIFGIPTTTNE